MPRWQNWQTLCSAARGKVDGAFVAIKIPTPENLDRVRYFFFDTIQTIGWRCEDCAMVSIDWAVVDSM